MKKMIGFVLSLCMLVSMAACGNQDVPQSETKEKNRNNNVSEQEMQEQGKDENNVENANGKRVLVVYFSATGNTKEVAEYIVEETGADILELEPVEPYSSDDLNWRDDDSRVVYEHDNPEARVMELVQSEVEDWDTYDTVFIGYPKFKKVNQFQSNIFIV